MVLGGVTLGSTIDQAHEQNNAMVTCSGGAIGLTGNPCQEHSDVGW